MKKSDIEKKTEELILPILDELKLELWDVEYVKEGSGYFLRAYIDREGGITIDDCVDVSGRLSDKLDEHDFIDGEYTLEISSPGVERPLKKDIDFERSIGREVYIKLYVPIDGQKEFIGTLEGFDKETVTVSLHNTATNSKNKKNNKADSQSSNDNTTQTGIGETTKSFNRKDIALIRLYAEF